MININNINDSEPYKIFHFLYEKALEKKQTNIEAVVISSFDTNLNEVDSRFVNLKYINNNEWIFFTNYNSPKANQFNAHQQISVLFYWNATATQIRIKANIKKTAEHFSDKHYNGRSIYKNALAHSSDQSFEIDSYDKFLSIYDKVLLNKDLLLQRPSYWGGFSFDPYYFEFWKGDNNRLNKRDTYKLVDSEWHHKILQP
ncbi:pyridoxamine 5'-phosphate oxidase family protein [Gammaproteobacteria bacterium]|nr:pyridoxamine 5'-phosphate oxidase family protein [Gammaproteobacteria bacterium]